jgi:aromatic ring hydroxylase
MLMSAADYRDSLRRFAPRVFVNGARIESVADEPLLAPGIAGVGVTYDFARRPEHAALMTARQGTSGKTVNRMLHIDETSTDLLYKLEAVRLVCRDRAAPSATSRTTPSTACSSRRSGRMPVAAPATTTASSRICTGSRMRT